jgi:hypothetical protein
MMSEHGRAFDAAQRAYENMTPEDVYGTTPCDDCDDRHEDGDTSYDRRTEGDDDTPTDCACPGTDKCDKCNREYDGPDTREERDL